jgi:hypothetical protein
VGGWVGVDWVSAPFQNTKPMDRPNPCVFVVFQPVTAKKTKTVKTVGSGHLNDVRCDLIYPIQMSNTSKHGIRYSICMNSEFTRQQPNLILISEDQETDNYSNPSITNCLVANQGRVSYWLGDYRFMPI